MSDNSFPAPEFDLIDVNTKEWIDARASWIWDQFGLDRISSCRVVVQTDDFFPDSFSETEESARDLLDRMCGHLGIDRETVDLSLYSEGQRVDNGETSLGVYGQEGERHRIWIEASRLNDPPGIAATMAHELCHVHLLGHGRLTEATEDHEPLTDLLTVFLGLGVITANSVLRDVNWQAGGWEGWEVSRNGYCTMQMYGYALALFAKTREEDTPAWAKHLRPDVRQAFDKSLRYFSEYGLPNLQSVQTTTALPTITPTDEAELPEEEDPSLEAEGELIEGCVYCGAELTEPIPEELVCQECIDSMDENTTAIEAEQRKEELGFRRDLSMFKSACIIAVVVAVILLALDWFGVTN